jgi:acetyltransferase-like isoleucine patch superfamily enzyme
MFFTTYWQRGCRKVLKQLLKSTANAIGLALVTLPALTSWMESRFSGREEFFRLWGQIFSLVPGLPGDYVRKCYYRLALQACSLDFTIGFLSQFTHRKAEVGDKVYIGTGALIGTVSLGSGCLIGSRVSIPSGNSQHGFDEDGRLTASSERSFRRVRIGAHTWIGEGATLMADVGSHCIVSAGAVVSVPVPDGCVVAGNPCRFVRKISLSGEEHPEGRTIRLPGADEVAQQG